MLIIILISIFNQVVELKMHRSSQRAGLDHVATQSTNAYRAPTVREAQCWLPNAHLRDQNSHFPAVAYSMEGRIQQEISSYSIERSIFIYSLASLVKSGSYTWTPEPPGMCAPVCAGRRDRRHGSPRPELGTAVGNQSCSTSLASPAALLVCRTSGVRIS